MTGYLRISAAVLPRVRGHRGTANARWNRDNKAQNVFSVRILPTTAARAPYLRRGGHKPKDLDSGVAVWRCGRRTQKRGNLE
jgi:hypothetical protein